MSKLANWREEFEHRLGVTSAEMKLLEDLIDGKIKPKPAARSFTENVDMTEEFHSPLYHQVTIITSLAVCSFDSAIQKIMVQLASEIRTLRKRSLKLGNKIPLSEVLTEMGEIIREWWPSLWSDSHDLKRANEYPRWISINEFSARLAKANLCDWTHKATFLLDDLLDNLELRENAILFSVALSAAAQWMLHAAFNVLTFCKNCRGFQGRKFRWEEWKAVFKEAETVENIQARSDAVSAAIAMDTAEQLYNSLPMKGKPNMTTHAMSKEMGQSSDFDGQAHQKNVTKTGRKRDIDEAFPEYYESET